MLTQLYDLDKLFNELYTTSIGFDRIKNRIEGVYSHKQPTFPKYDIIQDEDMNYTITVALAGYGMGDLDLTVHKNTLHIKGEQQEEDTKKYVHKGIASRSFHLTFPLDEYMKVEHANMTDGLLNIYIVQEIPKEKLPQKIPIQHDLNEVTPAPQLKYNKSPP